MKMTMHIDEDLLARVMKLYALESKTEAVEFALNELDRKARLKVFAREGLGFSAKELSEAVDPHYDLMALRAAETPAKYGKHRPGR